ncbi:CRAL-TRIO domain-containing protein C589.09, mitochondrial-like [Rutidosis leptorrhynchoides]|uniref:CRAL-TRIO domain-containing protein C589.09, mitochondrial-like n=1 Tax=Rutidosis leptorrhynchoides TaxID=125765 RepID=UPI003A9A6331
MDPNKAAKMFVAWQKWRASFVPLGFVPDSEILEQLKDEKVFFLGASKSGYPVVLLNANKHVPAKDLQIFKKLVVYMFDKGIASGIRGKEIGNEKFIMVMDMQKLGYKNVDANGFISAFQILQTYYPQRLVKLYILNMPWFFKSVWKMISYAIEKDTVNKIMIVSSEKERQQVITEVGVEVLPKELGGIGKPVPLQDVELPRLEC